MSTKDNKLSVNMKEAMKDMCGHSEVAEVEPNDSHCEGLPLESMRVLAKELPQNTDVSVADSASESMSSSDERKGKASLADAKFGFLGAGRMAQAIITGLIKYGKVDPIKIYVSAKTTKNLEIISEDNGVPVTNTTTSNDDIFAKYDCDVVFLCFHGSVIKQCLNEDGSHRSALTTNPIPNMRHPLYVLSLVSGATLSQIKGCLLLNAEHPEEYLIEMHRIFLSIACAFGCSSGGIDVDPDNTEECAPIIKEVLSTISKLEYIPEGKMDGKCAVYKHGLPNAIEHIVSLANMGYECGLDWELAETIAVNTAQSAALTLLKSGKHPSELMESAMARIPDDHELPSGVSEAMEAAFKRTQELGAKFAEKMAKDSVN